MRVKPSALTAILAVLGYLVVVFAVWMIIGLDYDEIGDTVENVRDGIVLSVGAGVVYLVIITTVLGWWKPAIHEPRRVGSRWMWAVPVLLLLGALINLATTKWGEIDRIGPYVGLLALGTLLVGFSEELLTRGLAIVGGRGSLHERWVWVFSSAIFGLIHVPNMFFGQGGATTVRQVLFAFGVGMTYYVTRRISGTLLVTMVLHTLWDFSLFVQAHSVEGLKDEPAGLGGSLMTPAIIVGIFALVKILKAGDVVEPGGDQLAALEANDPELVA
jgi:membrane protease YdiL (CAAX protease family)